MTGQGCCFKFARFLVILYNVIFLLSGLVLFALGIWLLVDPQVNQILTLTGEYSDHSLFRSSAILLLTMGCFVVLVTFIGCIGAIIENKVLLGIYIALIIIIFCGEVAGGVIAIAFKDKLLGDLNSILSGVLQNNLNNTNGMYYMNSSTGSGYCQPTKPVGVPWDFAQNHWHCCGVPGRSDYGYGNAFIHNTQTQCPQLQLVTNKPITCCKNPIPTSFNYQAEVPFPGQLINCTTYTTDCVTAIQAWVGHYVPVLIGIGLGIAMLQLFGIIFTVCLCRNVDGYKDL